MAVDDKKWKQCKQRNSLVLHCYKKSEVQEVDVTCIHDLKKGVSNGRKEKYFNL